MTPFLKQTIAGGLLAVAAGAVTPLAADTMLEQGPEHRFQLDFHVPDAALQKMLPSGWVPLVAPMGPAKDANIRMIFIDRINVVGSDGKPAGHVHAEPAVRRELTTASRRCMIMSRVRDAASCPGLRPVRCPR